MNPTLVTMLQQLARPDDRRRSETLRDARRLECDVPADVVRLSSALLDGMERGSVDDALCSALVDLLVRAALSFTGEVRPATARIVALYRRLGSQSAIRHHLLRLLAAAGDSEALAALAELVIAAPPGRTDDATLVFVPLFQRDDYPLDALFPRLFDALEHPAIAAVVLDLANYLARRRGLAEHPAAGRAAQLAALLGGLAARLGRLEERPREFAETPAALHALVGEAVTLIVSLCGTLAIIGDEQYTGKLHQALALSHRRVRTEAGFALARLGDEAGIEALVQMAGEPVVRTRALAYLEELDLLERANESDRSAAARAEGDLAAWLAHPSRFGVQPARLELVDERRQHWPGYAEPVDCFLFRYEYPWGERPISGVAIAGPVVHAMRADLADLPPADIYAAYAGWYTEHEEIREYAPEKLSSEQAAAWDELRRELAARGYEQLELALLGSFFGEEHYVATALGGGQAGVLIFDGRQLEWHISTGSRPLGPIEFHQIHKGRKLLRLFNR